MEIVAHIITGLDVGGAEKFLLRFLKARKGDIGYLVISLRGNGSLAGRIEEQGIPVHSMAISHAFSLPEAYRKIREVVIQQKAGLIQSWMYKADLLSTYLSHDLGIPLIWNVRQTNIRHRYNSLGTIVSLRLLRALSKRYVARIVYCAHASRQNHERAGYNPKIGQVIPNGIDISVFSPNADLRDNARLRIGVDNAIPVVGNVGRFDVQKGQLEFVACAARIHRQEPRTRFVMIGKGVTEENIPLMKAIRDHGLQKHFILMGEQEEIAMLLNGVDVFLGCSAGEGWPNAIAEAMATGVPCVATDVGDTGRVMGDTGYVHEYADTENLANSVVDLLRLTRSQRCEVGERERRYIVEHYSIELSVASYEQMYKTMLRGTG